MAASTKDIVTELERGPLPPDTPEGIPSLEASQFAKAMLQELLGESNEMSKEEGAG